MLDKLHFGMVGGGNGAFIADVHRHGATMDNLAILTAGCFTRNMEKNLQTAKLWDVSDTSRVYQNYKEMAEKESQREDCIDFVIIATPNDTHFDIAKTFLEAGIHVVCDKPLAIEATHGEELEKLAKEKGLLFGVTYTYTAYTMIRQAREMIEHGEIGNLVTVHAEYPQDWVTLANSNENSDQALWRFDPKVAGNSACCADIGTHIECLISKFTGLEIKKVLARFDKIPKTMPLETNFQALISLDNDVPGMMWASQVCLGHGCSVSIRAFGDKGALEWNHNTPDKLKVTKINQAPTYYEAGRDYLYPNVRAMARIPAGHNMEGFYESFGNIYRGFCSNLLALKNGTTAPDFWYPTVSDGLRGIKFVDACIESNAKGNVWVDVK